MQRFTAALTLLLLALLLPPAQTAAQTPDILSPFASSLRARETDSAVTLTWRDSPDIFETYHVFRHTAEIVEENFGAAVEVGTVPPGTGTFTDVPEKGGEYFYLVLIEEADGEGLHELFIPFRNKTVFPVAVSGLVTEAEISATVGGLTAAVRGDAVQLSFSTSRGDRSLTLYRHTSPITDIDALLEAGRIAMIESDASGYTDYPIPGIQYYYAVFDTKLIQSGTFPFNPGENVTVEPVRIAAAPGRTGLKPPTAALRSPPLPRIMLQRGILSGDALIEPLALTMPATVDVTPETAAAIRGILATLPERETPDPEPAILPQHMNGEFTGAAYTLALILREQFLKNDFAAASASLESFLSIRREESVEIAARFYLGQSYFFTGEYRKAFYEFLVAEEDYYPEAQPWIERIYALLKDRPRDAGNG